MKLTHTTDDAFGTTTITKVCRPLAVVNYLNAHIDSILVKSIKSTHISGTNKLKVTISTVFGETITITGIPSHVMPIVSWLDEAASAYVNYLSSIEDK